MVKKRRVLLGFTLIEVIIALSLFAVSVMVLTQSFVNGLSLKASLKHESKRPLMYEMIRASLLKLKRESVPSTHKFVYPASEDGFSWQGKVEASDWPSLFKVIVKIEGESEEELFWVRRPDWVSESEVQQYASKILNEPEREDVKL
jgi:prepilin-type N-terminal cleavage/methylation domain-containing protein